MMRSLRFKWMLAVMIASLVGVGLVGLVATRVTSDEFGRLRLEEAQANFEAAVTQYYQQRGSWAGIETQFRPQNRGQGNTPERPEFALADANGRVVRSVPPFAPNSQFNQRDLERSTRLEMNGELIGYVLPVSGAPGLNPQEQRYLQRTTQALVIGTAGAAGVSLVIGAALAGYLLRPLRELRAAIHGMQQGKIDQRVPVRTNDELGELAQAFNQMSAELARVNQQRRQMTADIAHDLRTPLAVIGGYLEGLRDGTLKPTSPRFEAMHREVDLLQHLIDDLRTLSLADAGELKLKRVPVAPRDLLERVWVAFQPQAEGKGIALAVEAAAGLPIISIDQERMAQVLGNLVSNALRYTPAGGMITLSAAADHGGVRLVVADTGEGIAADKLPYIFERFYRADEARQQNSGESGLGLAIARSIVEAHGGQISAESVVGKGTRIKIGLRTED